MNKLLIFVCVVLLICCENKFEQSAILQETETPQALTKGESTSGYLSGSLSSRKQEDIIEKLYNEALEKDSTLRNLDQKLTQFYIAKEDSLDSFYRYQRVNSNYWLTLDFYFNRIQDSLTKKSVQQFFQNKEAQFNKGMASLKSRVDSLELKSKVLTDQHILLKLFITQSMIQNYQQNELPSDSPLKNLNKSQDQLIKETQDYINLIPQKK